jgi:small nuclear ribonucleoprotein (snRNP)-like protein
MTSLIEQTIDLKLDDALEPSSSKEQEQAVDEESSALATCCSFLGSRVTVTCCDDRVIEGVFIALDSQRNLVLSNVTETRVIPEGEGEVKRESSEARLFQRFLNQAIIKGAKVTKIIMDSDTHEKCLAAK